MLRSTLVLLLTIMGVTANFLNPFYGVALYHWYIFATPVELTYGSLDKFRLSLFVAACLMLSTLFNYKKLISFNLLSALVLVFLGFTVASLALSGHFDLLTIYNLTEDLTKPAIMALVAVVVINSERKLPQFVFVVAVIIAFMATYYGGFGLFAGSRSISGSGKIGDNNIYAAVLVAALPLYLTVFPIVKTKILKVCALAGLAGLLLALLLTFSRGGLVGLFVVITLTILSIRKLVLLPLLILLLPLGYFLIANNYIIGLNQYSFSRDFQNQNTLNETLDMYQARASTLLRPGAELESGKSRTHFWQVGWEMAKEHPLSGIGLKQYNNQYDNYDFADGLYGDSRSVHSLYFSVLAETGFIGFGLFLFILFVIIYYYWSARRHFRQINPQYSSIAKFSLISLLGFLVSSLFVNTLYAEVLWLHVTIACGLRYLVKQTNV